MVEVVNKVLHMDQQNSSMSAPKMSTRVVQKKKFLNSEVSASILKKGNIKLNIAYADPKVGKLQINLKKLI